jgi:hemolysin III
MVFGFSSLYHFQREPSRKYLMKKWDHISIYYLIAGSYTPFLLAYASEKTAFTMLAVLWGLALAGTIFKIFFTGKFRFVSTGIYLAMGWSIVAAPSEFADAIPDRQFFWIWFGGIFYTVGVLFYLVKKIPYHHAIWHIFVLLGAVAHFVGVWSIFKG